MGWSRKFGEPILLPDGQHLISLRDAANHIIALPPETVRLPHWQLATEALSQVSEWSPTTHARRAFVTALSTTGAAEPDMTGRIALLLTWSDFGATCFLRA